MEFRCRLRSNLNKTTAVAGWQRFLNSAACWLTAQVARRPFLAPKRWPCASLPIASKTGNRRLPSMSYLRAWHERLEEYESPTCAGGIVSNWLGSHTTNGFASGACPRRLAGFRVRFSRFRIDWPANACPHREAHRADARRFVAAKPL